MIFSVGTEKSGCRIILLSRLVSTRNALGVLYLWLPWIPYGLLVSQVFEDKVIDSLVMLMRI